MNSFRNGVFKFDKVYVLFDCKVARAPKKQVGDWLPNIDGFEFELAIFESENAGIYIPVFLSRNDIPASLKGGRFIAKRSLKQVVNEAEKMRKSVFMKMIA